MRCGAFYNLPGNCVLEEQKPNLERATTMILRKNAFAIIAGLLLVVAVAHIPAGAQTHSSNDEVPPIILSGLDAYKSEGPQAAIKAWIKGSPVDGSKDALSQANGLQQIQDFYGAYKSFDVIRVRDLSQTTRVIYLILDYEKGPVFAKFVTYRTEQGWIVTNFTFNTKDELILPPSL